MITTNQIITTILSHYPDTQAIYLFGSYGTADERPSSDVDIAILLPHTQAKTADPLAWSSLAVDLMDLLDREVDVVNLRQVSTVFQMEIITAERRIYCADAYAVGEFEMLAFSYYQKLNDERREILAEFARTGRAYDV